MRDDRAGFHAPRIFASPVIGEMKITDALLELLCAVIFDSFVMVFCMGVAAPW